MFEYGKFIGWRLVVLVIWAFPVSGFYVAGCAAPIVGGVAGVAEKEKRDKWMPQAKEGNAEAQYQVGESYCCGRGAFYDTDLAIAWYCRAAIQGHSEAQHKLANIYAGDLSVRSKIRTTGMDFEDPVKAYAWYSVAASHGNSEAMKKKEKWEGKLNSSQREEAEQIIKNWNRQQCPAIRE